MTIPLPAVLLTRGLVASMLQLDNDVPGVNISGTYGKTGGSGMHVLPFRHCFHRELDCCNGSWYAAEAEISRFVRDRNLRTRHQQVGRDHPSFCIRRSERQLDV